MSASDALVTAGHEGELRPRRSGTARNGNRGSRLARVLLALLVGVASVLCFVFEHELRMVDAYTAAWLIGVTFAPGANAIVTLADPTVMFNVGHAWFGVKITLECASALFIGPLLGITAGFLLLPRFSAGRVLMAGLSGVLVLSAVNTLRIAGLSAVFGFGGRGPFDWAHSLAGSFLMLFTLGLCLYLFFRMVIRSSRKQPPISSEEGIQ